MDFFSQKFPGIFGALFFKKEKEEESVETLVGKAVASEKRGHMDKAEDFYHLAVKLAKEENRPDKAVYIFDMVTHSVFCFKASHQSISS